MTVPVWAARLAADFWKKAGEAGPFPRNLVQPIARAVPLTVVLLPRLSIDTILQRLRKYGVDCRIDTPNRALRACLIARFGNGFAFIDGTDSDDEQRFSLAHELAHFLRDYLTQRERACRKIGPLSIQVLDGERAPTTTEQVHAVLSQTEVAYHVHLLDRTPTRQPARTQIAEAEESADRLAFELLAPTEQVLASVSEPTQLKIVDALRNQFGLPEEQATTYAKLLVPERRIDPLLMQLWKATV